ncbi:MAG: TraB/GumN family protein [Leptospiraceae bacterium]|nr:TraB/GumN family protein [Leptospiraceae bacterium]
MLDTKRRKKIELELSKEPIRKLQLGDCEVTLIGTAHVSEKSVQAVQQLISELQPDTVCVELCESRLKAIQDPDAWKKQDIFKVFKERKMYLLLSSLILSSFQKKLGTKGVRPGDEMRMAISEAMKLGAKIVPVDREVQTTLKRSWGNVGLWSKIYLSSVLLTSLVVKEEVPPEKIEEMKSEDALKDIFTNLPSRFNEVKKVIIDERDIYLAQKIREAAKTSKKLVAVVGAGHLAGILQAIHEEHDLKPLEEIPKMKLSEKLGILFFPLLILSLFGYIFYAYGMREGVEFLQSWALVKGSLAALGAAIALAHPISIILAFLAAPIGNFNPIIKPGWLAALAESYLRKPLVEDFENIAEDSEHWKGYWKNRVIRIFLVLLLPQVGSSIGTFIVTLEGFRKIFS